MLKQTLATKSPDSLVLNPNSFNRTLILDSFARSVAWSMRCQDWQSFAGNGWKGRACWCKERSIHVAFMLHRWELLSSKYFMLACNVRILEAPSPANMTVLLFQFTCSKVGISLPTFARLVDDKYSPTWWHYLHSYALYMRCVNDIRCFEIVSSLDLDLCIYSEMQAFIVSYKTTMTAQWQLPQVSQTKTC